MNIEGVDVGVLYGTRGRQILMHDDLESDYAAALARAYNQWTYEFCQHAPERLKFAAQIAYNDVDLAVVEARRAVEELGAVAIIGNPNPVNGRHVHDPYFEPLWTAAADLDVPIGFHPDRNFLPAGQHRCSILERAKRRCHFASCSQPIRAHAGICESRDRRRFRASSYSQVRLPRGHLRLATLVAVASRRALGIDGARL